MESSSVNEQREQPPQQRSYPGRGRGGRARGRASRDSNSARGRGEWRARASDGTSDYLNFTTTNETAESGQFANLHPSTGNTTAGQPYNGLGNGRANYRSYEQGPSSFEHQPATRFEREQIGRYRNRRLPIEHNQHGQHDSNTTDLERVQQPPGSFANGSNISSSTNRTVSVHPGRNTHQRPLPGREAANKSYFGPPREHSTATAASTSSHDHFHSNRTEQRPHAHEPRNPRRDSNRPDELTNAVHSNRATPSNRSRQLRGEQGPHENLGHPQQNVMHTSPQTASAASNYLVRPGARVDPEPRAQQNIGTGPASRHNHNISGPNAALGPHRRGYYSHRPRQPMGVGRKDDGRSAHIEPVRPTGQESDQEAAVAADVTCVVCCEQIKEVCIGACDHKQMCAICCLRLRLCYDDTRCPLCKTQLEQVVIATWREDLPSFADYKSRLGMLYTQRRWGRGVYVDNFQPHGFHSDDRRHLSARLQHQTCMSCKVCDAKGRKPFESYEELSKHVEQKHPEKMCTICISAKRSFPLELEVFHDNSHFQKHLATHPKCEFCNTRFFGNEELYHHMQARHFNCHVCEQLGRPFQYYRTPSDLIEHLRIAHFMCQEPECEGCMVAFSTEDGLRQHQRQRHSLRMPRWDASRARPLVFDFVLDGTRDVRGTRGRRPQERQRPVAEPRAPVPPPVVAPAPAPAPPTIPPPASQEPGLRIVDDDLGMIQSDFPDFPAMGNAGPAPVARGGLAPWGQHAAANASDTQPATAFPSLRDAVAASMQRAPQQNTAPPARVLPRLIKHTVKCPCGRRVSYPVVAEGETPPPLECNAECERHRRQRQLAEAFDVEDPDKYTSFFDRQRTATYTPDMLLFGRDNREWLQGIEKILAVFLLDESPKRCTLPLMSKDRRAIVHQLAEQYGLITMTASGTGSTGGSLAVMCTPTATVPSRVLSHAAAMLTEDEVAQLRRQVEGFPLVLTDVSPTCEVARFLRDWDGQYTLQRKGEDSFLVRFASQQAQQAASAKLAGGIRGLFRVQRGQQAQQQTAAAGPRSSGGPAPAAGAPAASAVSDASWQHVGPQHSTATATVPQQPGRQFADPWGDLSDEENDKGKGEVRNGVAVGDLPDWEEAAELMAAELAGVHVGEVYEPEAPALEQSNRWTTLDEAEAA